MPRRRGPRLTTAKKTKKSAKGGDPEAPTDAEWETLKRYRSFEVQEDHGEGSYPFTVGDVALVVPEGLRPDEDFEVHRSWVAKIKEIRARGREEVWVQVQWYWSGQDVAGLIKSFDASTCGRYERIMSDKYDYVTSLAFNEVIHMNQYFEHAVNPPAFDDEEFFCRFTLEHKCRRLMPKVADVACLCGAPYNPDDRSEDHTMHFCPRTSCRRAFHRSCLIAGSFVDISESATLPIRLLASSPDTDEPFEIEMSIGREPPRKKAKKTPPARSGKGKGKGKEKEKDQADATRRITLPEPTDTEALLSSLPADLVRAATQPILKGGNIPHVGGNVADVVNARRIVLDALHRGELSEGWEEFVNVENAIVTGTTAAGTTWNEVPPLLCPLCAGPI